jgi:hypothetical protein
LQASPAESNSSDRTKENGGEGEEEDEKADEEDMSTNRPTVEHDLETVVRMV